MDRAVLLYRIAVVSGLALGPALVLPARGGRGGIPAHVWAAARDDGFHRRLRLVRARRMVVRFPGLWRQA